MSTTALTRRRERLPSMFDNFFKPWNELTDMNGWFGSVLTMPAVNIVENKDDFKISLAVPGMKKEDLNIDVDGNIITISSEKEESKESKDDNYTRREYNYSSFSRSFTLPEAVNKEKIDAAYQDGVLNLRLPKKDEAKNNGSRKHISVK